MAEPVSVSSSLAGSLSIACATCHREHHGANFNLAAMNDQACQTCHQQKYESFASDHPDFANWPYEERTPIAFDHSSHQVKHFRDKNQSFECRRCHVEDRSQSVQLLVNYKNACATCHDEKIATSLAPGIALIALPTLDTAALRAAGRDIGPWPQAATGDFDGRLPPMMKLLLSADPPAAKAMARLGVDFDFFDVDVTHREELAACADLAASIKRLLSELGKFGPAALRARFDVLLGRKISDEELRSALSGLSADTLVPAGREWLGRGANKTEQSSSTSVSTAGTWWRDDAKLTIRYQPTGHADQILTVWLTLLADIAESDSQPVARSVLKEMAKPTAPGLCASCHGVAQSAAGQLTVHWQPSDRTKSPRPFTKFSHRPHVLLPELTDCTACHTVDEKKGASKPYALGDAAAFVSDFRPMTKQSCATCHSAKAAGDNCQKCHNYHVGVESLGLSVEGLRAKLSNTQPSTSSAQPSKTSSDIRPVRR